MSIVSYKDVLAFWFSETTKKLWFNSTPIFDQSLRLEHEPTWTSASNDELNTWHDSPHGMLALIIVLDQFPLNMFRGEAKSFSTEAQAINATRRAISCGFDKQLNQIELPFLYMPLMHSENLDDQNDSVELFEQAGLENNIRFAKHHRDIIKKYGRFPHRNRILARVNTVDELNYLASRQAFTV